MISRRTFGKLAFAGLPPAAASATIDSTVHGVRIGVSGYSFQSVTLDRAIEAMKSIGLGATEIWFRHIEPKTSREELRAWRLSVPLDEFRRIGKLYDDAGVDKIAFTHDMKDDFTDAELERPFEMAKALGAARIAASTKEQYARIPMLHIRDGIRGQRGKVPWGTGDVRIIDVLQLLKGEKYPIVADIEYDYGGATDPWNEVKKCFDYCKRALE
jgi:hypothetical protein